MTNPALWIAVAGVITALVPLVALFVHIKNHQP